MSLAQRVFAWLGAAQGFALFGTLLWLLFAPGSQHVRVWVGYLSPLAFFILVNYWLRVAWRTPPDSGNLALS